MRPGLAAHLGPHQDRPPPLLAGRHADRLHLLAHPGPRGPRAARGGRRVDPADLLGRPGRPGVRLDAARPGPRRPQRHPRRLLARAAVPDHLLPRRPAGRRPRRAAALGPGLRHRPHRRPQGRRAGRGKRRLAHPPAHRHAPARAGLLEALPRRRRRTPVAGRAAAARRPRRPPGLPTVRRRPDRLPLRPRGRRQPVLVRPGRHRPAPPHRPRRVLRPPRLRRRHPGGLPVRRRPVDRRRPHRRLRAAPAGRAHLRPARRPPRAPGAGRAARRRDRGGRDRPGQRRGGARQPVLAHPPRRPGADHHRRAGCARAAAGDAGRQRAHRLRDRRGGRGRRRDRLPAPGHRRPRPAPARLGPAGPGPGDDRRPGRQPPGGRLPRRAADADHRLGRRRLRHRGVRLGHRTGPLRQRPGPRPGLLPRRRLADLVAPDGRPDPAADQAGPDQGRDDRRRHGRPLRGREPGLHQRRPLPGLPVLARLRPGVRRAHRRPVVPAGLAPLPGAALLRHALAVRPLPRGPAGRGRAGAGGVRRARRGLHRDGGTGEPGHAVPGRRLQVLLAHPGGGRRPGLAALADLRGARRDLRQPGRPERPAFPGALQHRQGAAHRTRPPPGVVRRQRRRQPAGRRPGRRTAGPARHRDRRPGHDRVDRRAAHLAPGRPGRRVAAGLRGGRAAHPGLLLGPRHVRHRLGRGPRPVPAADRAGRHPRRVRRPAA